MNQTMIALTVACALTMTACGNTDDTTPEPQAEASDAMETEMTTGAGLEIVPGLTMTIVQAGDGQVAEAGQIAQVHYTGWLHDPAAPDGRGAKFDSSVDRGQPFEFPLGGGRVIQGWDKGVAGMKIGEKRELIIAPELAYGDRQVGDLIPPGSTLLFDVELLGVSGP